MHLLCFLAAFHQSDSLPLRIWSAVYHIPPEGIIKIKIKILQAMRVKAHYKQINIANIIINT